MQIVDLSTFKIRKCINKHPQSLDPSYLNCPYYHSAYDRRRNPLSQNRQQIIYNHLYIEDFLRPQMCLNFIEYLFHPKIYKTIACKYRRNANYNTDSQCAIPCQHTYCPYIHEGQNLSNLSYRNLSQNKVLGINLQIKGVEEIIKLLQTPKETAQSYKSQIDQIKQSLKKVRQINKKVEQLPPKVQEPLPKKEIVEAVSKNVPVIEKNTNPTINQNWYTPYTYFQYEEKLPIIEDRHHQFKNFRDIINNSITPIVMKYIAAFLNSEGGVLYVGIDDSSIVTGLQITQHQFDKFLLSLDKEGKFNLYPPLMPQKYSVKRIPVYHHRKNHHLWVIEIKVTPVQKDKKILTTYNRQCYMRMNASTHKLDAMDLIQYLRLNQENKSEKESLKEVFKSLQKVGSKKSQQELLQLKQLVQQLNCKVQFLSQKPKIV